MILNIVTLLAILLLLITITIALQSSFVVGSALW